MSTRADDSAATFNEACVVASIHGMRLTNPSVGCYQLRHAVTGWIINLYPRHSGGSPRCYHDPRHKGPFLKLPVDWTLLDAVRAAADAEAQR